uniref:Uncharacterized protein n=1 Tax=Ciona intestinalis TaxID=7719 RepID=H2XRJ2_CIOIN
MTFRKQHPLDGCVITERYIYKLVPNSVHFILTFCNKSHAVMYRCKQMAHI